MEKKKKHGNQRESMSLQKNNKAADTSSDEDLNKEFRIIMHRYEEGKGYANLLRSEEEEGNGNMGSLETDGNKNISNRRRKSVDRKDSYESEGFGSLHTNTKSQRQRKSSE